MLEEKEALTLTWRERFIAYAPLILWIGVVFAMSSKQASMSQTSIFIRPLLEFLFPNSPEETLKIYHNYIRKLAHLTEYGILAFWASRAFSNSAKSFLQKNWFAVSLGLVALIATLDEINQSFLASRTGSLIDVLLDCIGGLLMLMLILLYKLFVKNNR